MLLSVIRALIVSLWPTAFKMDIPTLEDKGNDIGQEGVEEELEKKKEREDENEDEEVREEEKGMMNQAKLFLIGDSDLSL